MDEKTRELRDIFLDVAGDATVTDRQEQTRGSLATGERIDERLRSVVQTMRERYDFQTTLSTEALVDVVRGFYDGKSDAEIADDLGGASSRATVTRARIDLHLVGDRDLDAPFPLDELREEVAAGRSTAAIAERLGSSESTVGRYRRVLDAQRARRAVGDRFREEFDRILADRDLEARLTSDVRETGLDDATEGMESNVSF